jgi:hypothetical protein
MTYEERSSMVSRQQIRSMPIPVAKRASLPVRAGVRAAEQWMQSFVSTPRVFRDAKMHDFFSELKSEPSLDDDAAEFCKAFECHIASYVATHLPTIRLSFHRVLAQAQQADSLGCLAGLVPTLAACHQRDLMQELMGLIVQTFPRTYSGTVLVSHVQMLGENIYQHMNEACCKLNAAWESVDLMLKIMKDADGDGLSASELSALISPLHQQMGQAASAITELL